jgi:hypothetical protein
MGRMLITLGVLLIVAGLIVVALEHTAGQGARGWLSRLPLGRLPGDIRYRGRNVTVFAPLGTSLVISALLTLVLLVISRLRR